MSKRNKENVKRAAECMLAVVLVCALMIPVGVSGVFAKEDGSADPVDAVTTDVAAVQSKDTLQSEGEEGAESANLAELEDEIASSNDGAAATPEVGTSSSASLASNVSETPMANEVASSQIVFDLAQGSVSLTDDAYSGYDSEGKVVTGSHSDDNQYRIVQSNSEEATTNTISIGTIDGAVTKKFAVCLAGVNICVTSKNGCPIYANSDASGEVYLILANETENVAKISCTENNRQNAHAAIEKELNTTGLLCIACEEGYEQYAQSHAQGHVCAKDGDCGKLFAYADHAAEGSAANTYNAGAGIGTRGYLHGGDIDRYTGEITVSQWLDNLTIAGGIVTAAGAAGAASSGGGAGIGTGSCYDSHATSAGMKNVSITGGYINGIAGDDSSSCIGGGYRSNEVNLDIYGGTIIATNRVNTKDKVRGTGIGAGGGGTSSGSPSVADVKIHGGTIVTSSQYGAAIGGAGSGDGLGGYSDEQKNSQPATVSIFGGNITASTTGNGAAIGTGGPLGGTTTGSAGGATVKISGGSINATSESGADIGGGGVASSQSESCGGSADIAITGGEITATKGGIGGGIAIAGKGGDARIVVSGGDVNTPSIGGGSSSSNNGGNAFVSVAKGTLTVSGTIGGGDSESGNGGDASIYVSGGTLDCTSIGGGNSTNGKPGSVTSDTQKAGVVVTDGTLRTGTIGGGTNEADEIGFATADISGGNIQGQFVLANTDTSKQCFFKMTGGTIDNKDLSGDAYHKAQENGGAVYLSDLNGSVDISGGIIKNASARRGGAVYMTKGTFTLSGNAEISNCQAIDLSAGSRTEESQGGAVYLADGTVAMNGGCILGSLAYQGGAVYLGNGEVKLLDGTIGKEDSSNEATKGAGVYVAGGTLTVDGGSIAHNVADEGAGAYLENGTLKVSGGRLLGNIAKVDGAGAYLAGGSMTVSGGVVRENSATRNGGGVYMADGDLTVSGGSITANNAVDGAGAYLRQGNLTVSGSGDFSHNTASKNGAGAYLAGGALTLNSGTFNSNTATGDGGGAYLAGGVLTINGGSIGSNNAQNGGGAYAADGKVRMFGGYVTSNKANKDGGGLYVSSDSSPADVVVRSGSITQNTASDNGGGIAVAGTSARADKVTIGVLETHTDLNIDSDERTFTAFDYADSADNETHNHASCPVLSGNKATGNGGGVYMGSPQATLDVYCLLEQGNTSVVDPNGNSVMTEGGTVVVGDRENTDGDKAKNARGNVRISSSMLVSGGDVQIFGNMKNPDFTGTVLVNIRENSGTFTDHRKQAGSGDSGQTEVEYKIHYYENFKENEGDSATGIFSALQYKADEKVTAAASVFVHVGWKIVGWATEADLKMGRTTYQIGDTIGDKDNHTAWGDDNTAPLKLYAVWQRTVYTVEFNANVASGQSYTGTMGSQTFTYGQTQALTSNAYKVAGKRFNGWNLASDGTGSSYVDGYSDSKITDEDGKKVTLYAQWVDCTHDSGEHRGTVTYTKDDSAHSITEWCDCGGHTVTVTLSAADVWFDGKAHAATLAYAGGSLLKGAPEVTYSYRSADSGGYGIIPAGESVPTSVGYYQASITVGEQTVTVEYQIKSPAEGTTAEAKIAAGERFANFDGAGDVNVPVGGSFTVQFDVHGLTTSVYDSEPQLGFEGASFAGASVIMQVGDSFWYASVPDGGPLKLSNFKKMGDGSAYSYSATDSQGYRFIVDVPNGVASPSVASVAVSLSYKPNVGSTELNASTQLKISPSGAFGLQAKEGSLTVSAPGNATGSGWENHELVLVLSAAEGTAVPADAKLSVLAGGATTVYSPNQNSQFIVPLAWATSQDVSFSLSSSSASGTKSYSLNASLLAGPTRATAQDALISAKEGTALASASGLALAIPPQVAPSLKLTGTDRLFDSTAATLTLTIATANLDGASVSATIQKRAADGSYAGTYLSASNVTADQRDFSLANVKDEGSYRLLATATKDNQKLLEVPYYFVVK